jgi:hypothetical protein
MAFFGAYIHAIAAADTSIFIIKYIPAPGLGFRVLAPETAQITAL